MTRAPVRDPNPEAAAAIEAALAAWNTAFHAVAPDADPLLGPPASGDALARAARAMGQLPDELVSLWARHGEPNGTLDRWELEGPESSAGTWEMLQGLAADFVEADHLAKPDPGVQRVWWCPRWIPFAGDGAGNHLCVDLAPAPGGTVGQVIEFVHDHGVRPKLADSVAAWLRGEADRLRSGVLVVIEHEDGAFDGIMNREHLQGGTLGPLRIRGESPAARKERLDRDLLRNPGALTGLVLGVLRRGRRLRLVPGAFEGLTVWPVAEAVLSGPGPLAARLAALVEELRRCRDVAAVDIDAATLVAEVESRLS